MTTNRQFADQLRRQADEAMLRRRAMLVCSVALAETKTVAAARKVIAGWDGPAEVKANALELLDQLAEAAGA